MAGVDDPNIIAAPATVIGFAPAALTWLKDFVDDRGRTVPAVGEVGRA
jgi:hypothetical protein